MIHIINTPVVACTCTSTLEELLSLTIITSMHFFYFNVLLPTKLMVIDIVNINILRKIGNYNTNNVTVIATSCFSRYMIL